METKKNEKYELEPKRPMFFSIGLILSLSFVIAAFEWKSEIDPIIICDPFEYEPEATIIFQVPAVPEPPKPKVMKNRVRAVEPDEPESVAEELSTEPEPMPLNEGLVDIVPFFDEPEPVPEAPVDHSEVMPSYEGGFEAFYEFVSQNIRYPREAIKIRTEGRVFVKFIVEKDGSLSDIQVIKGIGAGCDKEAIRVMKMADKFKPGKQGDRSVRVRMVIPIHFKLY